MRTTKSIKNIIKWISPCEGKKSTSYFSINTCVEIGMDFSSKNYLPYSNHFKHTTYGSIFMELILDRISQNL